MEAKPARLDPGDDADRIRLGALQLPAGTPVAAFANADPTNPLNNQCPDLIENEGHYYGALLSPGTSPRSPVAQDPVVIPV